jgi:hypothetical protein
MPAYPQYMHIQKRLSVFSCCPSFQCVWLPTSGPPCHACVLCRVYVMRITNSVCPYGLVMFFISDTETRPICPTYLNGQSYFKWHTPPKLYMFIAFLLYFRCFFIVFVVLNAILLVFLNYFLVILVSEL